MARQKAPPRLAPGIWRDGQHLIGETRMGEAASAQQRVRKAFPLGTNLDVIRAWQFATKRDFLMTRPTAPARGSLAADIPIYLASLPAGRYHTDSVSLLAAWAKSPLGKRARAEITRLDVMGQISRWMEAGAAVNTCNRRLGRLRKLYQAMDGVGTPNPAYMVKFNREPGKEARDIPIRIVNLIIDSLPDQGRATKRGDKRPTVNQTKLRLAVMAGTGMMQTALKRVRTQHLDLDSTPGRVYAAPRQKGRGAPGGWLHLLPTTVEAFRAFVAAGLIGRGWSNSSMHGTWRRGIARARKRAEALAAETGDTSWLQDMNKLPPGCKPYDLRHSFASEIYRLTGDIRAVAELLQHAVLETTKRYTKGAVSDRVAAAIATATAAYSAVPTMPAPAVTPRRTSLRLVASARP